MRTTVGQLMTSPAISVSEQATFKEIVALLEARHISAVPVLDGDGRVVGIVSEADLILKEEMVESPRRGPALTRSARTERSKATGRTAAELMTAPAVTISPAAKLGQAARLMHARGVKRLPVTDENGRPVGIVSRADLLRVYLRADEQIRRELVEEVITQTLWMDPKPIDVAVSEGVVRLRGEVERRSDVRILTELATSLDGVVAVDAGDLSYRYDDSRLADLPPQLGARSAPFLG